MMKYLMLNINMKKIIIGILIIVVVFLWSVFLVKATQTDNRQQVELCIQYAKGHPETAINKERWEKMGYLWKDFDWFESCMKN